MKRTLLTLALISAAGAVGAQTATPPVGGPTTTAPSLTAPDIANKPANARISSEPAAKAILEADGYKSIGSLRMGADGKWSGSAMRGDKQVAVSVDANGIISTQ
jgi:hypothetical protein